MYIFVYIYIYIYIYTHTHTHILTYIHGTRQWILVIGIPTLISDSVMYGQATFAALNIAAYNVIGPHVWDKKGSVGMSAAADAAEAGGGSHLYGTEPWWFYLANCTINHNMAFAFFLCLPVCASLRTICIDRWYMGASASRPEKSSASSKKSAHLSQSAVDAKLQTATNPASHALGLGLFPAYLWIAFCECPARMGS
jgi:hypothetical protein